jgi:hypothetical protein
MPSIRCFDAQLALMPFADLPLEIARFPRSADLVSLAIHFASSAFPAGATV